MTCSIAAPPTARTAGYLPGTAAYRRVVLALFAAGLATFALLYSPQAVLPDLARQYDVSAAASTLALSLSTLGLGAGLLVAGSFAESVGRTPLIRWSLAASVAVAAVSVEAHSWPLLLVLRVAQGFVLAGLPAVATAYLREELHPSSHARAAGLYIGGTALGGMAGRLVTGPVADLAGWRWGMAATVILSFLCAVAVWVLLPTSHHFVSATGGLRASLARGRRALADGRLRTLYLVGACSCGALVAMFNILGFRLEGPGFGLGVAASSLVFLTYPLGTVSATVFGRWAGRGSRGSAMLLGPVIAVVGVLVTLSSSLVLVVAGVALLVVGFFATHAIASGWVPTQAHATGVATAQAASLYLFAYYAGSSVFGSLAGTAWSAAGWPAVVVMSTALMTVAGLGALRLRRAAVVVGVRA